MRNGEIFANWLVKDENCVKKNVINRPNYEYVKKVI